MLKIFWQTVMESICNFTSPKSRLHCKLHEKLHRVTGRSAEYGSFHQDLGCAKDQNLGAGAQKMVRCARKSFPGAPKYI